MAFYDDLAIARKALPFFNGLFADSLKLFPTGGKATWITFYPLHLSRYLAAALAFGGNQIDVTRSPFLNNLGQALLDYFEMPNSQELQRGLRTYEHRHLTAFLCRFCPTPGIASIYQAFVERERLQAKDIWVGLFDLLYAPDKAAKPAKFPGRSLFDAETGSLPASHHGRHTIKMRLYAGLQNGRSASFHLAPHNREIVPSLAAIEVAYDGKPLLLDVQSRYGIDSTMTNNMCLGADGGLITNGQYLNGNLGPEKNSVIRRVLIGERFVYAHTVITDALQPALQVEDADRVVVFDKQTGIILVSDAFTGRRCLRFATHLHCAGSIEAVGPWQYRLTGGQANRIAGIKGGDKGMSDEEYGELFVTVFSGSSRLRVRVYEPYWIPGYIYGLNATLDQTLKNAKYPRLRRWRLEMKKQVRAGMFLYTVSPLSALIRKQNASIVLPEGGRIWIKPKGIIRIKRFCLEAEAVLFDGCKDSIMAMGVRHLAMGHAKLDFPVPADIELTHKAGRIYRGSIYSSSAYPVGVQHGFRVSAFQAMPISQCSNAAWHAEISLRN